MARRYVNVTEPMLARAEELRRAGLSYADVLRVLELERGEAPHRRTLVKHLRRREPRG